MFGTSCPGAGRRLVPGDMAGAGLAQARRALTKPRAGSRAGAGAGSAAGRRLLPAAGHGFASKLHTRQVSPVSWPTLAVGPQPGLILLCPQSLGVPFLAKTKPPHPTSRSLWPRYPAQHCPAKGTLPFPCGELPSAAFLPGAQSQGSAASCATLPGSKMNLGNQNAELGFCWRAAG